MPHDIQTQHSVIQCFRGHTRLEAGRQTRRGAALVHVIPAHPAPPGPTGPPRGPLRELRGSARDVLAVAVVVWLRAFVIPGRRAAGAPALGPGGGVRARAARSRKKRALPPQRAACTQALCRAHPAENARLATVFKVFVGSGSRGSCGLQLLLAHRMRDSVSLMVVVDQGCSTAGRIIRNAYKYTSTSATGGLRSACCAK